MKLSEKLGVSPGMLALGNGSSEIIVNAGRAFLKPGDEILTSEKSFVLYYLCGAYMGNRVVQAPLQDHRFDLPAMAALITPHTRIIFIANPNNPTGTYVNRAELEAFLGRSRPTCWWSWTRPTPSTSRRPTTRTAWTTSAATRTCLPADVLQDLRPGRHPRRLRHRRPVPDRRHQPGQAALQRQRPRAGGRHRGAGRPRIRHRVQGDQPRRPGLPACDSSRRTR